VGKCEEDWGEVHVTCHMSFMLYCVTCYAWVAVMMLLLILYCQLIMHLFAGMLICCMCYYCSDEVEIVEVRFTRHQSRVRDKYQWRTDDTSNIESTTSGKYLFIGFGLFGCLFDVI